MICSVNCFLGITTDVIVFENNHSNRSSENGRLGKKTILTYEPMKSIAIVL